MWCFHGELDECLGSTWASWTRGWESFLLLKLFMPKHCANTTELNISSLSKLILLQQSPPFSTKVQYVITIIRVVITMTKLHAIFFRF